VVRFVSALAVDIFNSLKFKYQIPHH